MEDNISYPAGALDISKGLYVKMIMFIEFLCNGKGTSNGNPFSPRENRTKIKRGPSPYSSFSSLFDSKGYAEYCSDMFQITPEPEKHQWGLLTVMADHPNQKFEDFILDRCTDGNLLVFQEKFFKFSVCKSCG